jgi:AcrR family transcriptional regulator
MPVKGAQTRQNIIEKSMQLFCVKGYYNTSVNDILQATGLTKGGLYGHFAGKEDIWYAVYDEALTIWKAVVFQGIERGSKPLERIQAFIENDISDRLLQGFSQLAGLLCAWLEQADQQGTLKADLNFKEIASYIIISLNGAAALYASSRDPAILDLSVSQLHFYIRQLEK